MCVPGALGDRKRLLDPQELELLAAVSHHEVLGIESGSSRKAASGLNCRAVSPALVYFMCLHVCVPSVCV